MSRLLLLVGVIAGLLLPLYAQHVPADVTAQWENEITLGNKALLAQDFDNAELHYNAAIDLHTTNKIADTDMVLIPMNDLVILHLHKNEFNKAEQLALAAMNIIKSNGDANKYNSATTHKLLGIVYVQTNKLAQALPVLTTALKEATAAIGLPNHEIINFFTVLAQCYYANGDFANAKSYFEKEIALQQKYHFIIDDDITVAMKTLPILYYCSGDYKNAVRSVINVMDYAKNNNIVMDEYSAVNQLIDVYCKSGQYAKNDAIGKVFMTEIDGKNIDSWLVSARGRSVLRLVISKLIHSYTQQGNYASADTLLKFIQQHNIDEKFDNQLDLFPSLKVQYYFLMRYGSIKLLYENFAQLSTIITNNINLYSENRLTQILNIDMYGYTTLYFDYLNGELEKAQKDSTVMLAILLPAAGPFCPSALDIETLQVRIFTDTNHFAEAEKLALQVMQARVKSQGANHPDVATTLDLLAELKFKQAQFPAAMKYAQRGMAIRKKTLGSDNVYVADSLCLLARIANEQQKYTDSAADYKKALAIYEKTLPVNHYLLPDTGEQYARVLRHLKREAEALKLEERVKEMRKVSDGQ